MIELTIDTTTRDAMIDVTARIQAAVTQLGVRSGTIVAYVPHTTAGVTINEGYDPDVVRDALLTLDRVVPWVAAGYRHVEGNSAAHVKSILVGQSAQVFVDEGKLKLGTWQAIFFCEFDGPRRRSLWLKIVEDR